MQIAYGLNNNLQYIRESADGTNWNNWRILYSQSILNNSTVLGELASALGVGYMKQLGQIADASLMDNLDTFVAYCAPIQGRDIGYLYSFCGERYVGQGPLTALQIFYAYNDTDLYFRYYRVSSNSWNAWQRMDNFGCSTLEALASLLGASGWYDNAADGGTKYLKIGMCTDSSNYGDYVDFYVGWNTSRVQYMYKLVFTYHGCDIYSLGGLDVSQPVVFYKDTDGAIYIKITGWQTTHFKIERALGYTTYYNQAIPEAEIDTSTLTPITVSE